MKSKIKWQYAALISLSLFFGCKKEINQTDANKLTQENGTSSPLGIMCIPNSIQFFKTESLSQARGILGLLGSGLGNKVLFIQGSTREGSSKRVDIYNTSSDSWTVKILSEAKIFQTVAAGGTKIGIAGGGDAISGDYSNTVDIYDVNSGVWTVSNLSIRRGLAAGVGYGDSLYFGGGFNTTGPFKRIDVYNTLNGSWSRLSLSLARLNLAAAATNNKILFAGGEAGIGVITDRVDIYDVHTGTWSVNALSVPRTELVGAALGNLIIFGGGWDVINVHQSDVVDIYNTSTGHWSVTHISSAAGWSQSAVQGTKMFFGGAGNSSGLSVVDVYDICSNTWSKLSLTDGRGDFAIGAAGGRVLFGGGDINGFCYPCAVVKTVDIFNLGPLIAQ